MTSRRWCWTLNNWTPLELTSLLRLGEGVPGNGMKFICFGLEEGEEGTPHLQGYVEFSSTKRMTGAKSILGDRMHLERAIADGPMNVLYCSKTREEDDVPNAIFHSFGVVGKARQGKRTDLQAVKAMIDDGKEEKEIADEFFGSWVRYRQSFRAYRTLSNPRLANSSYPISSFPPAWQILSDFSFDRSLILWGPPNIGKTQFALALLPNCLMISHIDELSTFDPAVHSGIVFDDMSFTHMPISAQIHLVDVDHDRSIHIRYTLANIPANTKKIFTSNVDEGCIFDLNPNFGVKRRVAINHLDHFR